MLSISEYNDSPRLGANPSYMLEYQKSATKNPHSLSRQCEYRDYSPK
jgi:hypothetical protein